jgi:ribosome modulation factor
MVHAFERARLPLKVLDGPIQPRSPGIFQLDIYQGRSGEYVRLWPGARDSQFAVLDADADFRQVVLRVAEPRRPFEETLWRGWSGRHAVERAVQRVGGRIVRATRLHWIVERWTPAEERRYLCGFDEQTLFITQIRGADTVGQAHEWLTPLEVRQARSRWPGAVPRQGEWFFLPILPDEVDRMRAYARTHPRSTGSRAPVGPAARPHVADEVVRVDRRERWRGRERRYREVCVCGRVTHPDHRDVHLDGWRRAMHNNAVVPVASDHARLRWID